jgi:hypothetical protein
MIRLCANYKPALRVNMTPSQICSSIGKLVQRLLALGRMSRRLPCLTCLRQCRMAMAAAAAVAAVVWRLALLLVAEACLA